MPAEGSIEPERVHCHETNIPHRAFIDGSEDEQLYIDFDLLPGHVPSLKFSPDFSTVLQPHEAGVPIPLFIAAPWMILRVKLCQDNFLEVPKNFLQSRLYEPVVKPVPPADGCFVCRAVHYLRHSCRTIQECASFLLPLKQEVIFAIAREFNRRIRPKLFTITREHLQEHCRFSYVGTALVDTGFQFPLERWSRLPGELPWIDRRCCINEWTNGFMYLIRRDIDLTEAQGPIGCFIWSSCLKVLRCSLYRFIPGKSPEDFKDRNVYIDAIHDGYDAVISHIENMTLAIVEAGIELYVDPDDPEIPGNKLNEALFRACQNFFAMNMPKCFNIVMDLRSNIIHYNDHVENPEQCLCRFYEKLREDLEESFDSPQMDESSNQPQMEE
ncbi:unnamed protein product [Rodentolepis nana]|uniref:DUF4145 domain-containing protein n=1 Tax=Rodentolepis nana TaxID=102285 RepID=A0A0R3TXH8_RODNA|nr:unnamed protein product [Rodentolepis nana]